MSSSRDNSYLTLSELEEQKFMLNEELEDSESDDSGSIDAECEYLLDPVVLEGVEELEEIIVPSLGRSYVQIHGAHIPSGVILMIAAYLDLDSFVALSQANYAMSRVLLSQRISDSLYVRIPGLASQYTLSAIKHLLESGFPERSKQKRLDACANFCSCVGSGTCGAIYGIFGVLSSLTAGVTGALGAGFALGDYLLDHGYDSGVTSALSCAVAIPTFLVTTGLAGAAFAGAYELTMYCVKHVDDKAAQHSQMMQADAALHDKLMIFGLFENSNNSFRQITFYHHSNKLTELPKQSKMVP